MSKRLIPLLDRVLVEKIVAPTKSVGGILLPETAVSKARNINEGKVLAVGPGRRAGNTAELIPMGVKVGDKVLLPDYGGTEVKLSSKDGAKETFLYTDSEILGIVSDQ
ncbi:uncharacterized protein MICPUCDRAFT_22465 [Micromonas pusilla CCMP1545]|uniref:Protein groES n=1 Tax=Micromonas pusilla (strain CCMP1545) TaxID=564608 RepID=C1N664_MICPC|nr:uncharacterized protein MICPUCDRAFT_22465 [Micromonas pusilla CCMP1545]EEH52617.1 predicted protein [Micromonas pusilla CCMP1545]|eukprot:XP_003063481.1 predicted protein [Micromonas pusilla CCMP1545]